MTTKIVVLAHGGRNYDHRLLLKYFPLEYLKQKGVEIGILGKNLETVMSFTISNLDFKDNLQYAKGSLASLVSLLPDWSLLLKYCKNDHVKLECLKQKQLFPYSYLDSYDKLMGPILPPIEAFQDELSGKQITQSEYQELSKTLVKMGFDLEKSNFGDLLRFYNTVDAVQLAAVVLSFKKNVYKNYKIEALNFISLPGISENACLLSTGACLDLLTDYEMYNYFQKACMGGLCQSSLRYCESNDPRIPDTYDPQKPNSYIIMSDVVSLYGYSMTAYPHGTGNFRFLTPLEIENFRIEDYDSFGSYGTLLVVDLFIDPSLHDYLSLLPPNPIHLTITPDMLSKYTQWLMEMCKIKLRKTQRLTCTLYNVKNYPIHAPLLKLFVMLLKVQIKKIHCGIKYDQSYWLRDYIELNATLRKNAANNHESMIYKLMSNSAYGRFLLRTDKFRDFKLITGKSDFIKAINNPLFKHFVKVRDDLILVEYLRKRTLYNRPLYVASSILNVSKVRMYEFLYDTLCNKIGRWNLRYIYSDTDSYILSIMCEDIDKILLSISDELDTSNFPPDHPLYSLKNKKVPGKWVLEMANNPIRYVSINGCKAYAIDVVSTCGQNVMKLRGFPQQTLRENLTPENYRNALFNLKEMFKTYSFNRIESKNNVLFTIKHKRAVLMCHYIKSVVLPNAIDTLPFGHKDSKQYCC